MKKSVLPLIFGLYSLIIIVLGSCSGATVEDTDLVESGTYEVTVIELDRENKEVYAETKDGKVLELGFTDQTKLMKDGQTAPFSSLIVGHQLEVKVEKKEEQMEPLEVRIKNLPQKEIMDKDNPTAI